MSLEQGQDIAASFVPPQRTPVEFDPESNGLRIGPYERRVADPSDPDQVFGAYLSLLYAVRGAAPGEQLKLRSADLEALLLIVGDDPDTIEQRLIALMGCTAQEASVLGGALLRHRRLTATLGIAGALAMGGAISGDELLEGSSVAPRAAVVQSVAEGLRALDDAGARRGSVSFVQPSSAETSAGAPTSAAPTDDWIGSKPVGGSPDVPAGAPGDVVAETPSTPVAGPAAVPAVGGPAGAPAAGAPAPAAHPLAPPAQAAVADTTTDTTTGGDSSVLDRSAGPASGLGGQPPPAAVVPGPPGLLPVVVIPALPPVDVPPPAATDPTVHDNRDKLKNDNNGGGDGRDAADRDDNGKHSQTGRHVERGNGNSNSAGGVVP